jgi:Lar family restriction alleviation protein
MSLPNDEIELILSKNLVMPCPFCGKLDVSFQWGTEDREGTPVNVICESCGACGPNEYIDAGKESDYVKIIYLWNKGH